MRAPTGVLSRTGVAVLLALGSIAGLAACSDDDPKPGHVQGPTSASTTSSPSPTTPEAQIEATMRAYFAAANEMFKTGNVAEIRSFSTDGCSCRQITRRVERVVREGGEYRGTAYLDVRIRVHDVDAATGVAEVTATVPPYTVVSASGKVLEDSRGGTLHTDYSLVRQEDGKWIIGDAFDLG
jgi:hypothetical protein